jgi:16S rRNA (guanine(966)-N(2))-methyltransferase RsmD
LFNVLGSSVDGARVLDGYAGTGAVGIEALSRGASHVTFVESDARAARLIEANLERCGVRDRYAIIRARFADARLDGAFDILWLDPPYGATAIADALERAAALAADGSLVVIEHARRDRPPSTAGALVLTRDLGSGDSALAFYRSART